jgi:hypothetical protein
MEKLILLLINVFGGLAVIGSYMVGIRGSSGGSSVLWGGVPRRVRPVYTVSMILSAIAYLAVLYYLFFALDPDEVVIAGRFGYALFTSIYLMILLPSAFWMPLTNRYVSAPQRGVWIAVRTVLVIVGLASIVLAWAFFALAPSGGAAYWVALVGSCYFAFHTFILDAAVWAALFRRQP